MHETLGKTKFCINIIIDKIYIGFVNSCFLILQICNRVTALDSCQNLVFTQYLEKELKMRPNYVCSLSFTRSTLVI